jgi:hypothetical protein
MKIVNIEAPVFLREVKEHKKIKQKILDSISEMGTFSAKIANDNIMNTDYFLSSSLERKYSNIVFPIIEDHYRGLQEIGYRNVYLDNYWYQQYGKDDTHDWHVHSNCMFSSVYYVDLDEKNPKTSFKCLEREFDIEVSEGYILTFPSYLFHRSKKNDSDYVKTVISFNSNMNW